MFDTHAFIQQLTATGLTESQAEAISSGLIQLAELHLATKMDLLEMERRLDQKFAAIDTRFATLEGTMNTRFARIEGKLSTHDVLLGAILAGIISLVIKAFFV